MNAVITAKRTVTTGPFASGTILFSWKQQVPALLTGAFEDPLSFRSGTVTSDTVWESPAVELNNADVDVGTNVWLQQRGYVLGVLTYEFSKTPPSSGGSVTGYETFDNSCFVAATADETWYSASTALALPSAGTYFIFGQIQFYGQASSSIGWLSYRLYDNTNAAALTLELDVGSFDTNTSYRAVPICSVVTVAGAISVKVQVLRQSTGWTQAGIAGGGRSSGSGPCMHLGYLKIA